MATILTTPTDYEALTTTVRDSMVLSSNRATGGVLLSNGCKGAMVQSMIVFSTQVFFFVAEWWRFNNTLQKIEYGYNIIKISYKTKSSVLNTMVMLKMSRNGFLMEIFDFQYGTCSVRICVLSLSRR